MPLNIKPCHLRAARDYVGPVSYTHLSRRSGHVPQIVFLDLLGISHLCRQQLRHKLQLKAARPFTEHQASKQPYRDDAKPGHRWLWITKAAVNDGLFGKIRLPCQKLHHDLAAQGYPAQGKEMSAAMLLDIVHELIGGPLGGDIRCV